MELHSGKNRNLRGQLFSTELTVSLSIFLAGVMLYLFVWNSLYNNYVEEQADAKMQVVLIGISDAAVLSQGDPTDWDTTAGMNANSYGFATSSPNTLSTDKIYAMQSYFTLDDGINYHNMTEKMGAAGYDLYLDVKDTDGNLLYGFGTLADTTNSSISAVSAERLGIIGSDIVKLRVQLSRVRGQSI